jgi:hypothetical protein
MLKKIVFTFTLLSSLFIYSQIKVDTTFTLQSEYLKQSKKFPFIKKVVLANSSSIDEKKNIIYKVLPKRNLHLDAFINNNSKEKLPAVLFIHGAQRISVNSFHIIEISNTSFCYCVSCNW